MEKIDKKKHNVNSTQVILSSFVVTIMIGAILLSLPIASTDNIATNFLDCIFTATSSLCVTGLVAFDTATHWSFFGQVVILILIQLGGMGIILIASAITIIFGQKINLLQRTTLQEALSVQKVGGIIKLSKFIIKGFLLMECLGAVMLFTVFIQEFDILKAIWYSIFHSISAFCNAGFDLMGFREEFSSLTYYKTNAIINITTMLLIIVGGLGFSLWEDIRKKKLNLKKYTLQSKLVICMTINLIITPAIIFYFLDFSKLQGSERIFAAVFQSVTTRTAGFNTVNLNEMSEVGKAIMIILMLIGGGPGSTAGGMKVTTIFVLVISTIAIYRKQNEAQVFNRRIEVTYVRYAITIFILYITLFLIAGFIICVLEKTTLLDALFETASAIGTVGLTLGVTTKLSAISKMIIILLMFFGRAGGLTFIYAIIPGIKYEVNYVSENIAVG